MAENQRNCGDHGYVCPLCIRLLRGQIRAIHERHGTDVPEALPEPDRSLRRLLYEKLIQVPEEPADSLSLGSNNDA